MIKNIKINNYKSLDNIEIEFGKINVIAGHNGTGKTSILHLISNSFQAINNKNIKFKEQQKINPAYKKVIDELNLKVERLARDSKTKTLSKSSGVIYSIELDNIHEFRKHNSPTNERYAIKPQYAPGKKQRLIAKPSIYLGMKRLFPYGEYTGDISTNSKINISDNDQKWLIDEYKEITGIELNNFSSQDIPGVKKRTEFTSQKDGIDSNTISSGQEAILSILNAVLTLKYFSEILDVSEEFHSILLIDEFEATFHPSLQIKILKKLEEYCESFKIQLFITTHSFHVLEVAFEKNYNVSYFVKPGKKIVLMSEPNMFKIRANLESVSHSSMLNETKIPVFVEDAEARFFLNRLLERSSKKNPKINKLNQRIEYINGSYPCEAIKNIFDKENTKHFSAISAIGVLDGDQNIDQKNKYHKTLVALPGTHSPEMELYLLFFKLNENFWENANEENGYTFDMVNDKYIRPLTKRLDEIKTQKNKGDSIKGKKREVTKEWWKNVLTNDQKLFELMIDQFYEMEKENISKFENKLLYAFNDRATVLGVEPIYLGE